MNATIKSNIVSIQKQIGKHMRNVTYDNFYKGMSINTDVEKGLGCYTDILDKYKQIIDYMISSHSNVMQVRFDIHYPQEIPIEIKQKHLYRFSYYLKRDLEKNAPLPTTSSIERLSRHKVDPHILLVSEIHGNSLSPHIHCLVLVNGSAKRYAPDIFARAERQWANVLGIQSAVGLVHYCNENGPNPLFLKRPHDNSSPDVIQSFYNDLNAMFYQASYLAKMRGKESHAKGQWLCYSSRVPRLDNYCPFLNMQNQELEVCYG